MARYCSCPCRIKDKGEGTFSESVIFTGGAAGSFSSSTDSTGGNPGYRHVFTFGVGTDIPGELKNTVVLIDFTDYEIDLSGKSISQIEISVDALNTGASLTVFNILIVQDGVTFGGLKETQFSGLGWDTYTHIFEQNDLCEVLSYPVNGTLTYDTSSHPDFSIGSPSITARFSIHGGWSAVPDPDQGNELSIDNLCYKTR